MFSAVFTEAPVFGSNKIAVGELSQPIVSVRLEVLDAFAPRRAPVGPFEVFSNIVDPTKLVSQETAAIRSRLVRRVEWHLLNVSEKKASVEDSLDPICSPTFSAGGIDGLEMYLYPCGYRATSDTHCGFFLVCPKGVQVKFRAFVGDAVRTIEHKYENRGPFGRGGFCRLMDKVDENDSLVCGIELLEIQQELSVKVKATANGISSDQLKLTLHPSLGGMDVVRELRERPARGKGPLTFEQDQASLVPTAPVHKGGTASSTSPARSQQGQRSMGASQSLPALQAGSPSKAKSNTLPRIL